jgi:transporter family-2 protein
MFEQFWPLSLAALVGLAITFQGVLNSLMAKYIGPLQMAVANHTIGIALIGASFLAFGLWRSNWSQLTQVPWYVYLSGALGVFIVLAIALVLPRVGALAAYATVIAAQLVAATAIDHWGLFGIPENPLTLGRVFGVALLFAGAWLVLQK